MNKESASGGVGFFGLLALILITLRLTGVIDWSWWWITAPLWSGCALIIIIMIAVLALAVWVARIK